MEGKNLKFCMKIGVVNLSGNELAHMWVVLALLWKAPGTNKSPAFGRPLTEKKHKLLAQTSILCPSPPSDSAPTGCS